MLAAMQVAPFTDAIAKMLVVHWGHSAMQVAWARSLVQSLALAPLALWLIPPPRLTKPRPPPARRLVSHALRGLCWALATLFFFMSLKYNPLPSALALAFVAPLVVAALAPLLNERPHAAELLATITGFGGMLLVLQPGGDFSPSLLLALAAGVFYAGYIMLTRHAAWGSPASTVSSAGAFAALFLLPLALWQWQWPTAPALLAALAMGLLSACSHWMLARACDFAPASALAPLMYTEIIGASLASWLLLSELPNNLAWVGIAVIMVSGAFVSLVRTRRERAAATQDPDEQPTEPL